MIDITYHKAKSIDEAIDYLKKSNGVFLAGGTDILPKFRKGNFSAPALIDISSIGNLRFIRSKDGFVEIGSGTTHSMISNSELLSRYAPALVEAVRTIGCPQTRARGTMGGNLVNASPAADTVPPFLVLDAILTLQSEDGKKDVPLREFFTGPGKTILNPSELIISVRFPVPDGKWGSHFSKLGKRKGMAISVASAAAFVHLDENNVIDSLRIAYGSLAPTPVRGYTVEKYLIKSHADIKQIQQAAQKCIEDLHPISDVRATGDYRIQAAKVLTERVIRYSLDKARNSNV